MRKKVCSGLIILILLFMPMITYSSFKQMYSEISFVRGKSFVYYSSVNCEGIISTAKENGIYLEYPLYAKTVDVSVGQRISKGQRLFTVDKEKTISELMDLVVNYSSYIPSYIDKEKLIKMLGQGEDNIVNYDFLPEEVFASEDCVVTSVNVSTQSLNNPENPVVSFSQDNSQFSMHLQITESDYAKVSEGCIVKVNTPTGNEFTGVVNKIFPSVKTVYTTSGQQKVVELEASFSSYPMGAYAQATLKGEVLYGDPVDGFIVPYTSVGQDEVGEYVYKIEGKQPVKSYVQSISQTMDGIIVYSGLAQEDWIVQDISALPTDLHHFIPIYREAENG